MNVRTNHRNGHCGVSPPESQTPCHALFLVMQISTKTNNSHDITPLLSVLRSGAPSVSDARTYACMHACMHAHQRMTCTNAHTCTHKHLHSSLAGGNDRAPCSNAKVRKDQDTAALSGETSRAQLAAVPL